MSNPYPHDFYWIFNWIFRISNIYKNLYLTEFLIFLQYLNSHYLLLNFLTVYDINSVLGGAGVFVVYCRVKLWVGGGSVGLTNQITAYKTFAEQCDLNWPELNYGINLIPKLYSVTFHHGINLMPKFGTPRYPQNLWREVWLELTWIELWH